jgi:hypothetical protein
LIEESARSLFFPPVIAYFNAICSDFEWLTLGALHASRPLVLLIGTDEDRLL